MTCNRCNRPATHRVTVGGREVLSCGLHTASTLSMAKGFLLKAQVEALGRSSWS